MAKKIKAFMEKNHGHLHFAGDWQKKIFQTFSDSLPDKQVVEVVFSRRRHAKTLPQLGYWYAVLTPFATEELLEAGHDTLFDVAVGNLKTGVATTPQTVDLLFKTLFQSHKQLNRFPLKRNMTDEEMSELIDFTINWLAKSLGVVAPEPESKGAQSNARV